MLSEVNYGTTTTTTTIMAASLVRKFAVSMFSPSGVLSQCKTSAVSRCLSTISASCRNKSVSSSTAGFQNATAIDSSSMLLKACQPFMTSVRTVIRYCPRTGQPQTEQDVVDRFFRLRWGIYIRPRAGRHKHKWKKPDWINERGKYHVFCNKQQSRMLDKMTTKEWKKVRHYVNDPYEPYHKRTGMPRDYSVPKFHP